jgi:hypothetical protein
LSLMEDDRVKEVKKPVDLLADADVSRFDKAKKKKKKKSKKAKPNMQKTQAAPAPQDSKKQ